MPAVTLKAHFNGKEIVLDESFDLPTDSALITVLPKQDSAESDEWPSIAASALEKAYGLDEPDYSASDLIR